MALFDTNAFRISEQGLSVLWQKQQIIAENIANADTPTTRRTATTLTTTYSRASLQRLRYSTTR